MRDTLLGLLLFLAAILAYHFWQSRADALPSPDSSARGIFVCEGKTRCSEMHSCDEAKFYLKNCPNTKMDGDGDGIPCESQWCRTDAP
jgi:hypothetical protein